MLIGNRLRALREAKRLSQGDIKERAGLLRPYISRVENGHTVPSIDTLEKWARALEVPLYQLFHEGEEPPEPLHLPKRLTREVIAFGRSKKQARFLGRLRHLLSRIDESDRQLLLYVARRMASR